MASATVTELETRRLVKDHRGWLTSTESSPCTSHHNGPAIGRTSATASVIMNLSDMESDAKRLVDFSAD